MTIRNRPLIIEFTGTPNSGKTGAIHSAKNRLESMGYKVKVTQEDAELVPKEIPKKTWVRNMWIAGGQIQGLIEAMYFDGDIVFLDRGYYDAIFWADFLSSQGICAPFESDELKWFMSCMNSSFDLTPDFLFIFDVETEESLRRRYAMEGADVPVLSTNNFIDDYRKVLSDFANSIETPHSLVDTTSLTPCEVTDTVLSKVLVYDFIKEKRR